jgi:hypothetical protein
VSASPPRARRLLLAFGGLALVAGSWGGLLRLGWALPASEPPLVSFHGPLMVASFLGVVTGLERAVALGRPWGYVAPALAGLGGVALLSAPPVLGPALLTASSLILVAVFGRLYLLRPEWAGALLGLGAALLVIGNGLWLGGQPLPRVAPWWAGFLVLTIAGERLELAQLLLRARAQTASVAICGVLVAGLLLSTVLFEPGRRLAGLGLLALAGWGARYDVARRTLRRPGLPRFIAVCLLLGYAWLGLAGLLWLLGADQFRGGPWYDAMLHSLFVGFVFSMIFGHAPTIIPAVAGLAVPFRPRFYLHVGLLHASLLLRLVGDLAAWPDLRRWGGLLNAVAVLLFVLLTAQAATGAGRPARGAARDPRGPGHGPRAAD